MTERTTKVGVSPLGSAVSGISASGDTLVLTGARHVTPALTLGNVVTEMTDMPDMFRYKVEVDNTGIEEYYEYEEHKSASYVAADWLTDVEEHWGERIAQTFRGNVTVTDLWRQTTVDPASEGHKDRQKDSQKNKKAPLGSEDNPVVLPPAKEEVTEE